MSVRAISIHAHFYQPPRENPLTGIIPIETGAVPYSNWNQKIHAECYKPNAELQNFEQISFNIGPTLFSWMQSHDPQTTQEIINQDKRNVQRYGIGNAISQPYNHTILPLATRRDKITQVYWGNADFQHRFGRRPKGIWLPETAVDLETLEVISLSGIGFTILAPWQVGNDPVDSTEPYRVNLPKNKQISVFFYQQELSAQVSFQPEATTNADIFVKENILNKFLEKKLKNGEPQIILMASDGELYGHHQSLRHHFLARLVDGASNALGIQTTFPALWLKKHPPRQSVTIQNNTSWSCHHGVARWTGDCACTPGNGAWKSHLRLAFDYLSSQLDQIYFEATKNYFSDPWELRNRYIHVLLGEIRFADLVSQLSSRTLTSDQVYQVHQLLEAQRERQRMFTSCGWFFGDFDRIEPQNNVAYAAQAVWLVKLATGIDLEIDIGSRLDNVKSISSDLRASQVFSDHLRMAEQVFETGEKSKIISV